MRYIDPNGRMVVDFDNNTVSCDLNDPKDMQLTAEFMAEHENFACYAYDNNKGSNMYFENSSQMQYYLSENWSNGTKLSLIDAEPELKIGDNAYLGLLKIWAGVDSRKGNIYLGAHVSGPDVRIDGESLDTRIQAVKADAWFGIKDTSFAFKFFVAGGGLTQSVDIPIPGTKDSILRLKGTFYPTPSFGGGISVGLTTKITIGAGTFGVSLGASIIP